ncbi:3-isopropylmalate dehydrogenase, partial [Brucella oryzae]
MEKSGWTPFPNSEEAVKQARTVPQTPQTEAPAYRLAFMDDEFMTRRDLRPIRLQLEL